MVDYQILINRDNRLNKTYVPNDLVNSKSIYKNDILVNKKVYNMFNLMKLEALNYGFEIDIMSGYRDYAYQQKVYDNLIMQKGLNYAFRHIAPPGASEHQSGLAIDICVYHGGKCYVEWEIINSKEIEWIKNNAHRFGFILRYPDGKEEITGYAFEPWHFRYVGNIASYLYYNKISLEEYKHL